MGFAGASGADVEGAEVDLCQGRSMISKSYETGDYEEISSGSTITYLRGCFSSGFRRAPLKRVLGVFEDTVHVPCELFVPSGGGVLDQAEFVTGCQYFYKSVVHTCIQKKCLWSELENLRTYIRPGD